VDETDIAAARREVQLSAQTHAIPFYARHAFQAEGLDAGIAHRTMCLNLKDYL
jgi:predicted GNAT family N-acyltransferase